MSLTHAVKHAALGIVFLAIFSTLSLSQAPGAKLLARHPGEVIRYEIKFDGPNADRLKVLQAGLSLRGGVPKDQAGFGTGFGTIGWVTPSSPATFKVEMTIPTNIATGDYYLSFTARADEGSVSYSDGQEFNVPAVHIENPKTFTPPGVKVTPLP